MTKVLLVEDDNNLREIYEARLAAEGYEISTASDGEDALAVAKQVKPDLIISDVMMPRISGFEMLDILRNTDGLKHVKIIMLTALGQAEDQSRANSLGADKYLVKSQVTLEDIVKAADELLNPDEYANETPPAPAAAPLVTSAAPVAAQPNLTPTAAPQVAAVGHQPSAPAAPVFTEQPIAMAAAPSTGPTETQQPFAPAAPAQPYVPAANPVAQVPVEPAMNQPQVPVAENLAPAPQSVQTAQPVIQMPQPPIDPEVANTTAGAQTASQEFDAVKSQIENFVNTVPETAPQVQPTDQAVVPAPTPVPVAPINEAPVQSHEDLINNAANDLQSPVQPVAPAQSNQASSESNTPAGRSVSSNQSFNERVVQPPVSNTNEPDLAALVAQEEANTLAESGLTGQPLIVDTTGQAQQPAPLPPAGPGGPPAQVTEMPGPGGVFMPNQNGSSEEHAL